MRSNGLGGMGTPGSRPPGWEKLERHFREQVWRPLATDQVERLPVVEDALSAARAYVDVLSVLGWDWPDWLDGFHLAMIYMES